MYFVQKHKIAADIFEKPGNKKRYKSNASGLVEKRKRPISYNAII